MAPLGKNKLTPAAIAPPPASEFAYRWFLRRVLPQRKGQLCRVVYEAQKQGWVPDGAANRITVEFVDGMRIVTSRLAIKRVRPQLWRHLTAVAAGGR